MRPKQLQSFLSGAFPALRHSQQLLAPFKLRNLRGEVATGDAVPSELVNPDQGEPQRKLHLRQFSDD
jgi:hypothetical protein